MGLTNDQQRILTESFLSDLPGIVESWFADVWAQGFEAGEEDWVAHHPECGWEADCLPNPYREGPNPHRHLRREYAVAWDGEPKMGGGNQTHSLGGFTSYDEAHRAARVVRAKHPRIRTRWVSEWKDSETQDP